MITEDINRRAMDLVNREVQCCMTSLISTLAQAAGVDDSGEVQDLMNQAARCLTS